MEWNRMRTVRARARWARGCAAWVIACCGCAAWVIACCGCAVAIAQSKSNAPNGMTNDIPGAQQGIHLISPVPSGQWTLPAGDYANTRYSPLAQINTSNVQKLHVVAAYSTGIPHGH